MVIIRGEKLSNETSVGEMNNIGTAAKHPPAFTKNRGSLEGRILLNTDNDFFLKPLATVTRGLYYKTFYGRNLRMFVKS